MESLIEFNYPKLVNLSLNLCKLSWQQILESPFAKQTTSNLRYLDLSSNPLQSITEVDQVKPLRRILHLNLYNTDLLSIRVDQLAHFENIQSLRLDSNRFTSFNATLMPSLQRLHLASNHLTGMIQFSDNLRQLTLDDNPINKLQMDKVNSLLLEELSLINNLLTSLGDLIYLKR